MYLLLLPQIFSLKLLQQCRNVCACHCYTPSLSASDQLDLLPGVVTLYWGLLVQHPGIVQHPSHPSITPRKTEAVWNPPIRMLMKDLLNFQSLVFLLLLRTSHDPKPSPFHFIQSFSFLSYCFSTSKTISIFVGDWHIVGR